MHRSIRAFPFCALLGLQQAAGAQTLGGTFLDSAIPFDGNRGENISVQDRRRPDYDAAGIRTGAFLLFPRVRLGLGFTNNVFGEKRNPNSDGYALVEPNLAARSDWSRHAIGLDAGVSLRRLFDYSIRDEDGYHAGVNGRLDIGDSNLSAIGRITKAYEAQYSGSFPVNAAASVPFVTKTGQVMATYQGARFRVISANDVTRLTFSNIRALDGSTIDEQSRDRTVLRTSNRIEFAANPDAAAFGEVTYTHSNYDDRAALGGVVNRDSNELRVLGGATFDLAQLFRGAVGLGYVRRNYTSSVYNRISGFSADVRVQYFLTQLTTISLTAKRQIQDSITPGSGGFFATGAIARVDHELLRNLLLNLEAGYERDKFNRITRRDNVYRITTGADYFLNRHIGVNGAVTYVKRQTSGQPIGQAFDEFRAIASIVLQV